MPVGWSPSSSCWRLCSHASRRRRLAGKSTLPLTWSPCVWVLMIIVTGLLVSSLILLRSGCPHPGFLVSTTVTPFACTNTAVFPPPSAQHEQVVLELFDFDHHRGGLLRAARRLLGRGNGERHDSCGNYRPENELSSHDMPPRGTGEKQRPIVDHSSPLLPEAATTNYRLTRLRMFPSGSLNQATFKSPNTWISPLRVEFGMS